MKNIIQSIFGAKDANKSNKLTAWLNQLEELDDIAALQFSAHQLTPNAKPCRWRRDS